MILLSAFALPVVAQIFNFSLRSNNEQLIDEALSGAFFRINQSYELCDTVNDEHFGRGGKDYFSIIPFIAVNTEKGVLMPSNILTPWDLDQDFSKYEGIYKPIVTASSVTSFDRVNSADAFSLFPIKGVSVSPDFLLSKDFDRVKNGLPVDSLAGMKKGWLVWLSSKKEENSSDSLKFLSIRKNIEVQDGMDFLSVPSPDITEPVYGGIYVTPSQSSVGQLTFSLTGVIVRDKDGWRLEFPFLKPVREEKSLTPIRTLPSNDKSIPLKKKKK